MEPIFIAEHISARFGTFKALRDISFQIFPGEIVGMTGLSGSGKSVITNLIAGQYPVIGGRLLFKGKPLVFPFNASRTGIEIIHQAPMLVDTLDITANTFLGYEIGRSWFQRIFRVPNQAKMDNQVIQVLAELGMKYKSLRDLAISLTNEQRQLVSIARTMVRPFQLLVIDEPTTLLSYEYQQKLLSLVQGWQADGKTIIYCSTNLDHLFAVTDRILVLQNGRYLESFRTDETNREEIVAAMVGHSNRKQLTPAIWALDSYYRAREETDRLYQQTSLMSQDNNGEAETLNQQLLAQLSLQVKTLDQANTALQNAQRRLLTEREMERKHLARELHDQVIQDLLSTSYELDTLANDPNTNNSIKHDLAQLREAVRQSIEDVRRICGNLRPPTIDSLGVGAAIQSHANNWSGRTGIRITLNLDLQTGRLPEETELSIFRIVQEALNNIARHASATHVKITLSHSSPRNLRLVIQDNGRGLPDDFDLSKLTEQGHYGLIGISERVALLSGHLRLTNRPDGGMLLQAEIPHPRLEITDETMF